MIFQASLLEKVSVLSVNNFCKVAGSHFDSMGASKAAQTSNPSTAVHSMLSKVQGENTIDAGISTSYSSVNTTIKTAAYFALFGFMGFSIVWLFLIICLIYESYCPI